MDIGNPNRSHMDRIVMATYVIELHTRADRRGDPEYLIDIKGPRREARVEARRFQKMRRGDGTVAERWISP